KRLLERGNSFFAPPISQDAYGFPLLQKYRLGEINSFLRIHQNMSVSLEESSDQAKARVVSIVNPKKMMPGCSAHVFVPEK
ncbi:MAG: hypothetical protein ACLFUY_10830, partial [Desulfobacterales bacterium]